MKDTHKLCGHLLSQIYFLKREISTKIISGRCLWKFCKIWESLEYGERNGSVHKYPFYIYLSGGLES